MSQRLRAGYRLARTNRSCVVKGCGNDPGKGRLICQVHAEALRPAPEPTPPVDAA